MQSNTAAIAEMYGLTSSPPMKRVSKITKMYLMGLVMCFILPPENEVRIVSGGDVVT